VTAALPAPVVDAGWLAGHLGDVVVADVRWYLDGRSGRAAYDGGHVPGAVFVDVDRDLAAPPTPAGGRHPLPAPAAFAAALGRLGIAEGTPVVAYDDAGGSTAARLWWLLHLLGQPAAVLDGGIGTWAAPLSTGPAAPAPVERRPRPWPAARLVDADAVAAGGAVVLDARSAARYAAGDPAIDPRPGHIPGARSAPWTGNLDPATGRFLAPEALRHRFVALGAGGDGPVVAYCGSGVTACHDLLALERAGLAAGGRTRLFPGSWSAWGADPSRPAETGPDPDPD
jgi:thiosulfate/3-mercaptopyruvate sulfurtransferase